MKIKIRKNNKQKRKKRMGKRLAKERKEDAKVMMANQAPPRKQAVGLRAVSYFEVDRETRKFRRVFAPLLKMERMGIIIKLKKIYSIQSRYEVEKLCYWSENRDICLLRMFVHRGQLYPLPSTPRFHESALELRIRPSEAEDRQQEIHADERVAAALNQQMQLKQEIQDLLTTRTALAIDQIKMKTPLASIPMRAKVEGQKNRKTIRNDRRRVPIQRRNRR